MTQEAAESQPGEVGSAPLEMGAGFVLQLLDCIDSAVVVFDAKRRITYWNRGAERITGYRPDEVLGRQSCPPPCRHVSSSAPPGRVEGEFSHAAQMASAGCLCLVGEAIDSGTSARVYLRRRDGRRVPVEIRAHDFLDIHGQVVGRVEILSDVSSVLALQESNAMLSRLAARDHLTNLPNRRALDELVERELEISVKTGSPLSTVLVDLDHFKQINDTWGHAVGDSCLKQAAELLTQHCRPTDHVGRFGGDEFLILLPGTRLELAESVAERLRFSVPLVPTGWFLAPFPQIRMSLGVAEYRTGEDSRALLHRVDEALYRAKRAGRDRTEREESVLQSLLGRPGGDCQG